jgi:photosynthetic reaction center H subunit
MEAETEGGRRVLIPINLTRIDGPDNALKVTVRAINGHHFKDIPGTKHPDLVTKLEEEKIFGYFGGGTLYADASRQESII